MAASKARRKPAVTLPAGGLTERERRRLVRWLEPLLGPDGARRVLAATRVVNK